MLLGHARGKVGDLVFSRSNGQQVVRARAAVVKNPKTELQIIQRIILNTVAQGYSTMQAIVDHSFEGVAQGQKSMSRFMKTNIDALRSKIAQAVADNYSYDDVYAFTPIGNNFFSVNDFVIATGSLPSIIAEKATGNTTKAQVNVGGATYGEIIDALGLQRGDQLTFIMIKNNGTTTERQVTFNYARVILDPTTSEGQQLDLSTPLLANGAINAPSPRNTGEFTSLSLSDGTLMFDTGATNKTCFAAAVIVSRLSNAGEWMRSNTQLSVFDSNVAGFLLSLEAAMQFSEQNSLGALSDLYLNNAGTGQLASNSDSLAIELNYGASPTAETTATIVRVGYEDVAGVGSVLFGYTADNTRYAIAIGNSDSVYLGKTILSGAAIASDAAGLTAGLANSAGSNTRCYTNNEMVIWLNNHNYLSTFFVVAATALNT